MASKNNRSDDKHHYLKGWTFWKDNRFWLNDNKYSKKTQAYYESWLDNMRSSERQLTKLQ